MSTVAMKMPAAAGLMCADQAVLLARVRVSPLPFTHSAGAFYKQKSISRESVFFFVDSKFPNYFIKGNGMKEVHFVMQGKGGVGKSFSATHLAQFFQENAASDEKIYCYDTDSVNQTLARYRNLNARVINILNEHEDVDVSRFDELMEEFLTKDGVAVIDSGSSTFLPLMTYFRDAEVLSVFAEAGIRVVLHVIIAGGAEAEDTTTVLSQIVSTLPADLVLWKNEHFGEYLLPNGVTLEKSAVFKKGEKKIIGVVHLPKRKYDLFGKVTEAMTKQGLTYAEAMNAGTFNAMERQRLLIIKRGIFSQLQTLLLPGIPENGANTHASDTKQ
ncbi:P-loop NTPase family protein [Paralysiella testudinis]|uniref:Conjugal transfer protein TraL n=1 Tax=Paralysiella testudinis TaxID=2809020 RepID=A0A892ZKA2_9NEIS|nr:conjugal transfer protein TraL [Paralysiella testudinis]QRQ82890.1 conjugal transfer protein TraL [Paralysiella testudinis]